MTKKTLIQEEDDEEEDEETKAYKQRLRNVSRQPSIRKIKQNPLDFIQQPRKVYNDDEPKLKQTIIVRS